MLTIKIDTRETDIKAFFKDASYAKIERLPLGDIIFQWNGKDIWIIERKQISDLAHSIKDGRFREQKMRLLANYNPAQILYLIEGNLDLPLNAEVQTNLPVKTLYSSIYNMLLRDNLKVYKTSGMNETLRFLKNFVWKMQTQGESFMKQYTIEDYHDSNMKMKLSKKKHLDKPTCFMYQLCQIKGVSQNIAKVIVAKHPSWISLYKTLEKYSTEYDKFDYISRMPIPIIKTKQSTKIKDNTQANSKNTQKTHKKRATTRKIGQVVAVRIYNFMFT
jgi:crossover junction endonuclease MUS81